MAAESTPNEFKLNDPPTDGISAVKFSPTSSNFLIASSWDNVSIARAILLLWLRWKKVRAKNHKYWKFEQFNSFKLGLKSYWHNAIVTVPAKDVCLTSPFFEGIPTPRSMHISHSSYLVHRTIDFHQAINAKMVTKMKTNLVKANKRIQTPDLKLFVGRLGQVCQVHFFGKL